MSKVLVPTVKNVKRVLSEAGVKDEDVEVVRVTGRWGSVQVKRAEALPAIKEALSAYDFTVSERRFGASHSISIHGVKEEN